MIFANCVINYRKSQHLFVSANIFTKVFAKVLDIFDSNFRENAKRTTNFVSTLVNTYHSAQKTISIFF